MREKLVRSGWIIHKDIFDIPYAVEHGETGKVILYQKVVDFYLLTSKLPQP